MQLSFFLSVCYFSNSCSASFVSCPNVPSRINRNSHSHFSLTLSFLQGELRTAAARVNFCSTSGFQKDPSACLQQKILFPIRCWIRSGPSVEKLLKAVHPIWVIVFLFWGARGGDRFCSRLSRNSGRRTSPKCQNCSRGQLKTLMVARQDVISTIVSSPRR